MYLNPFAALIPIHFKPQITGGINDECNETKKYYKTRAKKAPGTLLCSY